MIFWNIFLAEVRKLRSLPAAYGAFAVAMLGSAALTALNSVMTRGAIANGQQGSGDFTSPFETAYAAAPLGTVGAVILGVIVIGSEYTANSSDAGSSRQIAMTLSAMPGRLRVLMAKALTVAIAVVTMAVVTIPVCFAIAHAVLGEVGNESVAMAEAVLRSSGAALYWTLTGLISLAITSITRNGVIPMIVLIINNSLVSVSLLLTKLSPIAFWLPDMAGRKLFAGLDMVNGGLAAVPGALVMVAWTGALLALAGLVFSRRDG